jgi:hypothetical protein
MNTQDRFFHDCNFVIGGPFKKHCYVAGLSHLSYHHSDLSRSRTEEVGFLLETGNSTVTPVWLAISLSPMGRGSQSFHLLPPSVVPTF